MASSSNFWLPPHFLSDHDKLAGKPAFPTDFPYDLSPSPVLSPVESEPDSTGDDDDDEEEDFLAALTQRLTQKLAPVHKSEAKTAVAGSPQSTLSGFGNWSVSSDGSPNGPSQAPSPPTTPFGGEKNTWELISAAAGQVARLKMKNHGDGVIGPSQSSPNLVSSVKNAGFYSNAPQFGTELPIYKPEIGLKNQQIHCRGGDFHHENGRFLVRPIDLPQSTWPSLQPHHRRNPSQPCVPRKECAGTGVFLPRRYDNNPPQSRRKSDCGSIPLFPVKNVHDMNRSVPQKTPIPLRLPSSYETLMGQRNAIFAQQRLSYPRPVERGKSHEFLLPQEWTY